MLQQWLRAEGRIPCRSHTALESQCSPCIIRSVWANDDVVAAAQNGNENGWNGDGFAAVAMISQRFK